MNETQGWLLVLPCLACFSVCGHAAAAPPVKARAAPTDAASPPQSPPAAEAPSPKPVQPAGDSRLWTLAFGRAQMKATFLSLSGNKVKLRKWDGSIISVSLDELSPRDREWIDEHRQQDRPETQERQADNARDSSALPARIADEAIKAELKRLDGTWLHVSTERNGEAHPEPRSLWVFQGNRATVHFETRPAATPVKSWAFKAGPHNIFIIHHFRLDPTRTPKAMDEQTQYPNAKELTVSVVPAIYKLEGDTLTICFAGYQDDGKRPSDFNAAKGSGRWVYVLKRER